MMPVSNAEYYTYQFYTWEYRGRGWFVAEDAIHLEPPFIPFFRHGFKPAFIDDGKRHTIVSKLIETIKGKKEVPIIEEDALDYEELEPFIYDEETNLKAVQVKLPKERKITPEKMKALIIMLSQSNAAISFEIIGNTKEIVIQFVCCDTDIHTIETYVKAYFPECTTILSDEYLENIIIENRQVAVIDFGLQQEFTRPIQIPKNFNIDPLTGVFGVLEQLQDNEQGGIQILFQGAVNGWSESIVRGVTMNDGSSFFDDDPNAPKLALEKIQSPLFGVTIRAFGQGEDQNNSLQILEKLSYALMNASTGATNQLIPLPSEAYNFETRLSDIYLRESHRLGMLLNADELTTLLHFPSENIVSKKLFGANRKTKEVPTNAKGKEFILGENYYNGITTNVTFSGDDRLKHTHIIGATGTGKSTLIANLILQDIQKGIGLVLFDPHGDLIDDVIAHIPTDKLENVVLIDPSDTEYPIGLNILEVHSEIEKEVLSSDLVASFRKYATSWGDQMNSVLGNAIQAILENKEGGTLNDLRRFLIEKEFRNEFLKKVTDPSVLYYWHKEYPMLKTNSIGSILTRLDTFLRPKSIRNMVIQQNGIDFEALFNSNKIVLLKLSQGLIGTENSYLLGSLILSKIHQAIFRRQQNNTRNPIMLYLDEFQNFITPSIKDMLSGIRKYNVGLTLSHQDLQQLQREDSELLNSVLGNINNRIVFRVGEPDAKKLQDGFSDFDFIDLQNLGRGEAIIRIEQPQFDCSLDTLPLKSIETEARQQNIESVLAYTRKRYATSKAEVEKLLLQSFDFDIPEIEKETEVTKPKPVEKKEMPKEDVLPVAKEIIPVVKTQESEHKKEEKDVSTHRYLQTLVKKMAEARGYTAVLEMQIPEGSGQVDVLLTKEGKTIAVEICNTTDADWEMHNIQKCITADYDTVISLCGDPRQLEKIKKKCIAGIPGLEQKQVHFFTPDALFAFLDDTVKEEVPQEQIIKGYRVNVTYDSVTPEDMQRKRASVAQVVMNSLRKQKKK
jgi:Type IV secretion-system coupling protein DNA-binding domain